MSPTHGGTLLALALPLGLPLGVARTSRACSSAGRVFSRSFGRGTSWHFFNLHYCTAPPPFSAVRTTQTQLCQGGGSDRKEKGKPNRQGKLLVTVRLVSYRQAMGGGCDLICRAHGIDSGGRGTPPERVEAERHQRSRQIYVHQSAYVLIGWVTC